MLTLIIQAPITSLKRSIYIRSIWKMQNSTANQGRCPKVPSSRVLSLRQSSIREKINDPEFIPVNNGRIFSLGGRKIEVIHARAILQVNWYYLTKRISSFLQVIIPMLLSGSAPTTCRPLSQYLTTLEMLQGRMSEYTTIFPAIRNLYLLIS